MRHHAALFALFATLSGSIAAQDAFDIAGLRLGMEEEQVIAALQEYDPDIELTIVEGYFNYSDGINYFETDSFLSEIQGRLPGSGAPTPEFIVRFTPPPAGGKVWAIDRQEKIASNQPSFQQYTQALVQKYGNPTEVSREGAALAWDFPAGRTGCLRNPRDTGFPYFRPRSDNDLDFRLQALQRSPGMPATLTECASQLNFVLASTNGSVVDSFNAILIDVPVYVASSEAASASVEALEQEAIRKREGEGQIPRL